MATHNYLDENGLNLFWQGISPLNSATGSPATFTSEFALPLDQCIANIDYTSSGVNKVTITVNGTATQISLGSTVYGGTLDVIHGIITSNKASDGTELSEPIITYITPVQITPIVGSNTISANTGSISLKYTNSSNIQEYADIQLGGASGNPATFNTSLALPLVGCSTSFTATQEGSGDPYPAGGSAQRWDEEWVVGGLRTDGEIKSFETSRRTTSFISVAPNTTYREVSPNNAFGGRIAYYDENQTLLLYNGSGVSATTKTFTTPDNCHYVRITIGYQYGTTYNNDISINYPSTDTAYHPYSNIRHIVGVDDITITTNGVDTVIDLNGTRYGGTVDVVNGVAHCTHSIVDLGSLFWYYFPNTNPPHFGSSITGIKRNTNALKLCSIFKIVYNAPYSNANLTIKFSSVHNEDGINASWTDYTDRADFRDAVRGQYLVYELATPFDIQLTPTQITTIIGSNSIESDTGNIKVSYIESKSQLIDRIADYTHATGPAINNATLTIQKNGTTIDTFTANASTDTTANIIVPTKTSDITNDSDFKAVIKLTQAEYDALEIAGEVDPETLYFITDGTPKIYASNVIYDNTFTGISADNIQDALDLTITYMPNAEYHNGHPRGKYLGDHVTDDQYNAISSGEFTDLYIGDYWIIHDPITNKDITWVIVHFDYWVNTGDANITEHHIVVAPATTLYDAKMNATDTTTGGYLNSQMKTNLSQATSIIETAFGSDHILSHREMFSNATTSSGASGSEWSSSTIDLMNEIMVYGCKAWANSGHDVGVDKEQLSLFKYSPKAISGLNTQWLRSVVSDTAFATVTNAGTASYADASNSLGVRPVFALKQGAVDRCTEDGFIRITEDGDTRITE